MDEATNIRKQVYDLQPADLERFPIWEFALDEEGEAAVGAGGTELEGVVAGFLHYASLSDRRIVEVR